MKCNPGRDFSEQKNRADRRCSQPWILGLDADEAVSPELAAGIRAAFANGEPRVAGFFVNRRTWYLGAWIWHVWYPEWRLRLTRQGNGQWAGIEPHAELQVTGPTAPTARLPGDLLHDPFDSLQDHLQNTIKYARLAAVSYAQTGRPFRWRYLVASPWVAFFKHLVLKNGWRDGWRGWIIATAKLINVAAKYAFLLEHERTASEKGRRA